MARCIALVVLVCATSSFAAAQSLRRTAFPMTRLPPLDNATKDVATPNSRTFPSVTPPRAPGSSRNETRPNNGQLPPPVDTHAPHPNGSVTTLPRRVQAPTALSQAPLGEQALPETLQAAWQVALSIDQQRMAGQLRVSAADSTLAAAAAGRYPTAGISGQYTVRNNERAYQISSPLLPISFSAPYLQSEELALAGSVDVPIYTGGQVTSQIAAAASSKQVREHELSRYQLDLKMRVAEDFVAVLRAEQEYSLAQCHQRSLASHARDVAAFHQQERAPLNDLLGAQVALADAQHRVIRARSELDAARASYNRRLGRPLTAIVNLAQLNVGTRPYDVQQLTAAALTHRQELAELDARIETHSHRAESALAQNRAQVHFLGAYTFRENRYESPNGITSAGIGVWWNLYDGGRVKNVAEEESRQAQVYAHLRADVQAQIQLEVRRAWLSVEETRQRLAVTRQAINRAEENLRVTRQRYSSGMATNTEVLAAETLRMQTYRNYYNSQYDGALAELKLHRTVAAL